MRTIAVVAGLSCALFATTAFGASQRASLRLVDRSPLTVAGSGFVPESRLVVSAFVDDVTPRPTRKTVYATERGTFRVAFSAIDVDRCSSVRVVAKGPGGEAMLKLMPQVACMPALSH
jgi:hypothetical protein